MTTNTLRVEGKNMKAADKFRGIFTGICKGKVF